MIRTPLRYHRPGSVEEVSVLLLEHDGDVAVLGGGSQLLPQLTRGERSVGHLVDPRGLGLRDIAVDGSDIVLGALVSYDDLLRSPLVAERLPHLARVSRGVTGGRQIRNAATPVGAVCFGMPGSDMPAALAGLGARYRVHGPRGWRDIAAADFHTGAYRTALEPGEFVVAAVVAAVGRETGYCKVKHSAGSWPIVTATWCRRGDEASITLGGLQAVPLRVPMPAQVDGDEIADRVAAAITEPWSDVLAPGSYRARIAGTVAYRAYKESRA
jgi:aerobic carbon-monoxide dehydrogenase medium subunit